MPHQKCWWSPVHILLLTDQNVVANFAVDYLIIVVFRLSQLKTVREKKNQIIAVKIAQLGLLGKRIEQCIDKIDKLSLNCAI